jgi:integrase
VENFREEARGFMGAVRKIINKSGKASWQIDYVDPTGKRVRQTFKKKKDADAEIGKRVSLMAENRYLDVKKDYKTTLDELLNKYEENYQHQSSFQNAKKSYLKNFCEQFGKETLLANIRYVDVETYRNHLRQKPVAVKKSGKIVIRGMRTDASVNREMSCLHHIFTKAVEWELIEQSPFDRGKSLILKENNERIRFLNEDEIQSLIGECPEHLRRAVVCGINTGMRRGEILSLRWCQIRNGFIYLEKKYNPIKTREARQIPVNEDLEELFNLIKSEQNPKSDNVIDINGKPLKHKEMSSKYVFTYQGEPFKGIKTAFKKALNGAGIDDFRFHDLRHTFASQVILNGGSLKDVQELLGHKTMTMTLRYAHLTQERKRAAVNLLNGLTAKKDGQPEQEIDRQAPMSENVRFCESENSAHG